MAVGSTAGFAETGVLVVDKELISYSRKTPTAFLGLSRGYACAPTAHLPWWWMHCDAKRRRSSSLGRPFAVRHGAHCVVNAGITPVTSSASTARAPLMEPLALAAELARYDIVFTTYTALTVQERLGGLVLCCLGRSASSVSTIVCRRLMQFSHRFSGVELSSTSARRCSCRTARENRFRPLPGC